MRRLLPAYWSCLILLLLTAAATVFSFRKEAVWIQSRFEQLAKLRQQAIVKAFNDKLLVIESMQSVFRAINDVPRPEFGNMANPFQQTQPGIDGYRWIAAITGHGSVLQDFAAGLGRVYPAFRAWERGPSGEQIWPQPRDMHYLVMPLPDGSVDGFAGFDLASRDVTAKAIDRALAGGGVLLSAQFEVASVADAGNRRVIAFAPVFRRAEGSRGDLIGLIAGMFDVPVVMQSALDQFERASVRLQVLDLGDGAAAESMYQTAGASPEGGAGFGIHAMLQPQPYTAEISLGGRRWSVHVEPEAGFVRELGISSTLVILLCGVLVSFLVPGYFAVYTRKEARLAESRAVLRETQMQLLHSQKLEVVGEMTSGIAHDFNNVLLSVMVHADMAAELDAARDGVRLRSSLQSIVQGAEMGAALAARLGGFSRRTERNVAAHDLAEIVRGSVALLKPLLGPTVQPQLNTAGGCWSMVDKTEFEQLVLNLCINARDAIRELDRRQGLIAIDLAVREVTAATCASCGGVFSGEFAALAVKDNGGGIAPQTLKSMFDPFYTTKPDGKGTGLGLSIVHSIVHNCAGHLGVESVEGEGATFTVYLPRCGSAPLADQPFSLRILQQR